MTSKAADLISQLSGSECSSCSMHVSYIAYPYPIVSIVAIVAIVHIVHVYLILLHGHLRSLLHPLAPPCLLVALGPVFLHVAEDFLDLVDHLCIARVLPDVVTNLDRGGAVRG